jgi:DedD protein
MSDQNFHEIQLSGKQLVFLFISAVGVAVVIFLLGVSVGRGVRGVALAGAGVDTAPSDTVVSTNPPPATQPGPGELSYHNTLQGSGRAGAATPPPTPPSEPVTPPPSSAPPPVAPPAATPQQTPPPQTQPQQAAPASKTPSQPPPAPASPPQKPPAAAEKPDPPQKGPKAASSGAWVVQVMALRSKEGADKLVGELKNKGYPAFVVNPANSLYRVRVGPFAKRAEAEQIAGRLAKEGYQSPAVQAR